MLGGPLTFLHSNISLIIRGTMPRGLQDYTIEPSLSFIFSYFSSISFLLRNGENMVFLKFRKFLSEIIYLTINLSNFIHGKHCGNDLNVTIEYCNFLIYCYSIDYQ